MSEPTMMRVFVTDHSVEALDVSTWPTPGDDGHAFVAGLCEVTGRIVGGDHHGEWVYRGYRSVGDAPPLGQVDEWPITITVRTINSTTLRVEPA